jgi:superfamily II DNA or RNA helicase
MKSALHDAPTPSLAPGTKVEHPDLGEGVILLLEPSGFARVFFRDLGERQVAVSALRDAKSWISQVIAGLKPATPESLLKLRLAIEAEELPLIEGSAALTSAKIDLLPHQLVLVDRIARTQPRRFLVADEVGLGKTIEAALILRELASRGELQRAMMIVPAGLVENWRRELNDVFNLDFEVFGSEGDITDRKTNAFAKHHRIIASVDTLKRPARIRRILEAPPWDLIVFDEAHHLSVYRSGNRARKTENYKLAEAIRPHCRDLLLLSATPHQGDHFRFWMLVHLLDAKLFHDERDMLENRHRLNAVVIRRTKADACAPDGSPLFARRIVHTEAFELTPAEKRFYEALTAYLNDGYDLARARGGEGRSLGFVMTIFQKIAASSFAAVRRTLEKRQLMLTIQESIQCDELLDVDGRNAMLNEARELIHKMHALPDDTIGRAQVEQILADAKLNLLRKHEEAMTYALSAESYGDSEREAGREEDLATNPVVALPEERRRIRELLSQYPDGLESKALKLLDALNQIWRQNPTEKVVVFATYLGSVEGLQKAIAQRFPAQGVEVLKGGDHGAKTAAQRRFRRPDGPNVLVCTAAGREGINLQFARILFNFDLPWNPMDLEQRIGRIHRYGQRDTAQVYNFVTTDTIEGNIFLLLDEKLHEIARTLGKVDENGEPAEDFRMQVLGQLNTRLNYERLYQEALADPSLKRTRQEIEVAMSNAERARQVVFELFQDLDKFNLQDYRRVDDGGVAMRRLLDFSRSAVAASGGKWTAKADDEFEASLDGSVNIRLTTNRDRALRQEGLALLGLEQPFIRALFEKMQSLPASDRALTAANGQPHSGCLTFWAVTVHGKSGHLKQSIVKLAIGNNGARNAALESLPLDQLHAPLPNHVPSLDRHALQSLLTDHAAQALHRDLEHRGELTEGAWYSSRLLALLVL